MSGASVCLAFERFDLVVGALSVRPLWWGGGRAVSRAARFRSRPFVKVWRKGGSAARTSRIQLARASSLPSAGAGRSAKAGIWVARAVISGQALATWPSRACWPVSFVCGEAAGAAVSSSAGCGVAPFPGCRPLWCGRRCGRGSRVAWGWLPAWWGWVRVVVRYRAGWGRGKPDSRWQPARRDRGRPAPQCVVLPVSAAAR